MLNLECKVQAHRSGGVEMERKTFQWAGAADLDSKRRTQRVQQPTQLILEVQEGNQQWRLATLEIHGP